MKYKSKHIIEYLIFRSLACIVLLLPLRGALALAWFFAATTHFVGRVKVERTRQRVRQVFGDQKTEKEVRRIAWISWRNLFFSGVESIRFPKLSYKKITKFPLISIEKPLKEIHRSCDGRLIVAIPHFGNWEMAGIAGDLIGIPLFTIARKQKNPLMNNYINKMRGSFSLELLFREARMWKGVVDRIKAGKVLAILPDINSKKGVTVDFLNHKSTVAPGAAHFARMADCPIYPALVRRVGWAKHDAKLLEPIYPDITADKDADLERMMSELMAALSTEILKDPEQYFWHNSRWVLNA